MVSNAPCMANEMQARVARTERALETMGRVEAVSRLVCKGPVCRTHVFLEATRGMKDDERPGSKLLMSFWLGPIGVSRELDRRLGREGRGKGICYRRAGRAFKPKPFELEDAKKARSARTPTSRAFGGESPAKCEGRRGRRDGESEIGGATDELSLGNAPGTN